MFTISDYIWNVILLMDQKDMAFGKWSPIWEFPFRIS